MSDTLVINTSTEYINLSVITTTEQYNVSVVDGTLALWGTIFGSLSTQTDLWRELSAKALEIDLQSLSGQVVDLETFIAAISGTWNGGQQALTVLTSNSANWDFSYDVATYVQANSGSWEESAEIIPTVTNYLSTVPVTLSSADVRGQLLSSGTDLFDIFLTTETDSQTLSYTPSSYSLSISNGNTVNLSSINTTFAANSGKYENVYSNVVSNSANWNTAFDRSTVFSSVSGRYNSSSTAVESNSANWNNAYNTSLAYQSVSGTFATNSTVSSVSGLLTPLTLTRTLTSQLLPTTTYQQASGNWQDTYTNFSQNSATYCTKSLALAFAIAL
jgi:hypothetical protein